MSKLTNGVMVGAAVGLMAGGMAALLTKERSGRGRRLKHSAQNTLRAIESLVSSL